MATYGNYITANDNDSVSLPKAIVGAALGAIALGIVYGLVGRFVGEFKYIAIATGVVAGMGSFKLGGGRSIPAGIAAGALTLIGMLAGKLLIPAPGGTSWIAYHTTLFDILFCYVGAPVAAFAAAGTNAARPILDRLGV